MSDGNLFLAALFALVFWHAVFGKTIIKFGHRPEPPVSSPAVRPSAPPHRRQ